MAERPQFESTTDIFGRASNEAVFWIMTGLIFAALISGCLLINAMRHASLPPEKPAAISGAQQPPHHRS